VTVTRTATPGKARPAAATGGRFAALDVNKDGKISAAEFKGPKGVFARIDADHNGYVTRPEATRAYLAFLGALSIREKVHAYKAMDTDRDGKISAAEFKGPKPLFAAIDTNHDGRIAPPEAKAAFGRYVRMSMRIAMLKAMDTDKDGKLTTAEFKGTPAQFARLDVNKDGVIRKEDVARVIKQAIATAAAANTAKPAPAVKTAVAKAPAPGADLRAVFTALDTDKNGKLGEAEMIHAIKARFAAIDADHDGYLTRVEVAKVIHPRAGKPGPARAPNARPAGVKKGAQPAAPTAKVVKHAAATP
jgi:Ca2+-binding EF-hand superfamily protein